MARKMPKHWAPNECRGYCAIEKYENTLGMALYLDEDGEDTWPNYGPYRRVFMEIPGLIILYNAVIQITDDVKVQEEIIEQAVNSIFEHDKKRYKEYFKTFAFEANKTALGHYGPLLPQLKEYSFNGIYEYKNPGPNDVIVYDDWNDDEDEKEVKHVPKRSYSIDQT